MWGSGIFWFSVTRQDKKSGETRTGRPQKNRSILPFFLQKSYRVRRWVGWWCRECVGARWLGVLFWVSSGRFYPIYLQEFLHCRRLTGGEKLRVGVSTGVSHARL
eukprot:g75807.t1